MTKDKKFILMNLDDERSKKVAEVLKSETCKKILDYLAENKEKSEEDIAKDLKIPINTVEYNLKKLFESGLIEKAKKFFWSKKGKKIILYKPANRHIVISPKRRPSKEELKTILPVIIAAVALIAFLAILLNQPPAQIESNEIQTFSSLGELKNFLEANQGNEFFGTEVMEGTGAEGFSASVKEGTAGDISPGSSADDYSTTNIQVEGVDEADIVKNDGKYIYIISGEKLFIVDAFPAENMKILSETELEYYPIEMFVNEDKLVLFVNSYKNRQEATALVYDITDRENPKLEDEFSIDGNYITSRMIGSNVYLIANQYTYFDDVVLPGVSVDGLRKEIAPSEIAYFPVPDTNYVFTNILAFNLESNKYELQTYLTGASSIIYVSENNIYLTYTKRISYQTYFEETVKEIILPLLPSNLKSEVKEIMSSDKQFYEKSRQISEIIQDYSNSLTGKEKSDFDRRLQEKTEDFAITLQKRTEKTVIHKIEIDGLEIDYITNGEVSGRILNQFSMDEYKGNFRIATTTGNTWGSSSSLNHLYVLDEDLKIIGSVEDLAKGERIYSARFMGDRAYMVTFRQVDPLFVIDLSQPKDPEVLGYLKVTGFSSYLHPYDENHIIGIGKEATEQGRVQGVKIALFDVSDVSNPVEKAKYEIKGQWSDSNALYDHKAFLFDKKKELLVLPISYSEELTDSEKLGKYEYWQGAFVFKINTDEIALMGQIDHKDNKSEKGYYYSSTAVKRSLYMNDVLYTISGAKVKANSLINLDEISFIELPYEEPPIYTGFIEEGSVVDTGFMGLPVEVK